MSVRGASATRALGAPVSIYGMDGLCAHMNLIALETPASAPVTARTNGRPAAAPGVREP